MAGFDQSIIRGASTLLDDWQSNLHILIPTGVAAYALVVRLFRYQRRRAIQKKYYYPTRESLASMSNDDAQAILTTLSELEFPFVMYTSLQFALFRTYGIPTISKLLVATKELSNKETASKRYTDTTVLLAELSGNKPRSERTIRAISRMNYIHGLYQKAGKISQDDLLYTLSVFISQPIAWVERYEWRKLTPTELCAISTFWKSIGDSMGIEYNKLEHYKTGWKDGIEFYEDIYSWANNYEKDCMVPAASNRQTADETTALILYWAPKAFHPYGKKFVTVMMDERLREAMIYDPVPQSYHKVVATAFAVRKFLLRYFALPRPSFMSTRSIDDEADPQTGRYHLRTYQSHPWYLKPGFWNRWGPEAWLVWVLGGDVPGTKGDMYIPQGYKFEEVGPKSYVNKGSETMKQFEEKIRKERPSGCPFAMRR